MHKAETVLKVLGERGKDGKCLERLYRQLFKPSMYELAYSQIYANPGATTKGASEDTMDEMSKRRIDRIIQKVKMETYKWNPVRRTHIPEADGRKRPLGIPSGNDKLLQATLKLLLEAYYEPQFSDNSHGFRPNRGCHTALVHIDTYHRDAAWFIEGDIKGCFDSIDHETLIGIMGEKIKDSRILRLISNLLKAGYMEDWAHYDTLSGTPQGGIISPLLTNIYMNVFDEWVEKELLPRYNRSLTKRGGRRPNPEYNSLSGYAWRAKRKGDHKTAKKYRALAKELPTVMTHDEGFRKLKYVRYADDFLLSFGGPKQEAMEIKEEIRAFLKNRLKLELSEEKTLITHAKTQKAKFLGYELRIMNSKRKKANGCMWFGVPREVVTNALKKYTRNNKPHHRAELMVNSDYEIITTYQSEVRGLIQYYIMAHNLSQRLDKVKSMARFSLLKTLATKHKSTVSKIASKYSDTQAVNGRTYKVIRVSVEREGRPTLQAHFGGIPTIRDRFPSKITDLDKRPKYNGRNDLLKRLNASECEMCGDTGNIEVHHVRKLKDLNRPEKKPKANWEKRMIALKRKTLIVCKPCHAAIHRGATREEWSS